MAAKKAKAQYIALYSDCGEDSQLKTIGGDDGYVEVRDTIKGAQSDADGHAESQRDNSDSPCDYVIVQVIARGKSAELVWK